MYEKYFDAVVKDFQVDGRYRVFNDILRERGAFPEAIWYGK
jgi:hypothetical protein